MPAEGPPGRRDLARHSGFVASAAETFRPGLPASGAWATTASSTALSCGPVHAPEPILRLMSCGNGAGGRDAARDPANPMRKQPGCNEPAAHLTTPSPR